MINVLLATFTDVIKVQQDHVTGNADMNDVLEAKKRFSQALNEYIDYRIDIAFEQRRRKISSDRIAAADSINAGVKSMATAVKSISALNSAPPPPTDPKDVNGMEKWKEAYADWYENKRKSRMIIG
jgi:hypothetical protein